MASTSTGFAVDLDEAVEYLKGVLSREPGSRLFLPLANLLGKQGKWEEALETAEQGLARHPDYTSAIAYASLARYYLDDLAGAKKGFEEVVKRAPDHYLGFKMLGKIYQAEGDTAAAIGAYQRALGSAPGDWECRDALEGLGVLRGEESGAEEIQTLAEERRDEAISLEGVEVEVGKEEDREIGEEELAEVEDALDEVVEVAAEEEDVLEEPDSLEEFEEFEEQMRAADDLLAEAPEEALEAYLEILEADPDNESVRQKVDELKQELAGGEAELPSDVEEIADAEEVEELLEVAGIEEPLEVRESEEPLETREGGEPLEVKEGEEPLAVADEEPRHVEAESSDALDLDGELADEAELEVPPMEGREEAPAVPEDEVGAAEAPSAAAGTAEEEPLQEGEETAFRWEWQHEDQEKLAPSESGEVTEPPPSEGETVVAQSRGEISFLEVTDGAEGDDDLDLSKRAVWKTYFDQYMDRLNDELDELRVDPRELSAGNRVRVIRTLEGWLRAMGK